MNYITRNIYKNHKYYWKLIPKEKKYFLYEITKSIINGCYEDDVKEWNEQTFRAHFNTNKRKREETDQENKEPVQPEFLTDTDISEEDLKQFKRILHQRKFDLIHRKESKQGMINPNNKNLIIKLGYGAIKEEISKHRHICIMYYGEQSHFSQDILPRLTKLFKYVWETPYNLKLQYDIPYCNLIIPEQITNNDIQKQIRQEFNYN